MKVLSFVEGCHPEVAAPGDTNPSDATELPPPPPQSEFGPECQIILIIVHLYKIEFCFILRNRR